ncbi:MAG: glycosyltransferase family 4 protein [Candidatus Thorarchaeota archaeon]
MPKRCVRKATVFVEHFPPFLGSDRTIFEIMKRIADKGVLVHFIATQPLRHLLGRRPADWVYTRNWTQPPKKIHKNIDVTYLLRPRRFAGLWKRFYPLAYFLTLIYFIVRSIRNITQFSPDIIIAAHASPIVGVVSLLSSKITLRPLVMSCPDWISAYAAGLLKASTRDIGPALLQMLEIRIYKWSDLIVTATSFLRGLLVSHGVNPSKIITLPNGVDPDFFSPNQHTKDLQRKYRLENRTVILFTGHLEEWAGISLIHDLAKRLDKDFPDSIILLVGVGDAIQEIFGNLVKENLGHMLTHAGLQPFEEMPRYTAAADIALCIFPNTPVAHAASPLKLFEYMSAGKAIVATNVAGTNEVLRNGGGILVAPDDRDGICDAVLTLCQRPDVRERLGKEARELVLLKYSWNDLASAFFILCERVACK